MSLLRKKTVVALTKVINTRAELRDFAREITDNGRDVIAYLVNTVKTGEKESHRIRCAEILLDVLKEQDSGAEESEAPVEQAEELSDAQLERLASGDT